MSRRREGEREKRTLGAGTERKRIMREVGGSYDTRVR